MGKCWPVEHTYLFVNRRIPHQKHASDCRILDACIVNGRLRGTRLTTPRTLVLPLRMKAYTA